MDSIDLFLEEKLLAERLRKELNMMTPNNPAYSIISSRLSETEEKLSHSSISYTNVNLGYSICAYAAFADSGKEFLDRIFDQACSSPSIVQKNYYLCQNGRFSLRIVAADSNGNTRGLYSISLSLPGKQKESPITIRFYLLSEKIFLLQFCVTGKWLKRKM